MGTEMPQVRCALYICKPSRIEFQARESPIIAVTSLHSARHDKVIQQKIDPTNTSSAIRWPVRQRTIPITSSQRPSTRPMVQRLVSRERDPSDNDADPHDGGVQAAISAFQTI